MSEQSVINLDGINLDDLLKVADYLDGCQTCGRVHHMRVLERGQTWSDPDDGHGYVRRNGNGSMLRSFVEEQRAAQRKAKGLLCELDYLLADKDMSDPKARRRAVDEMLDLIASRLKEQPLADPMWDKPAEQARLQRDSDLLWLSWGGGEE